jgi:hypothetical protein
MGSDERMLEPRPRKLLDQVRDVLWAKHYSYSTEKLPFSGFVATVQALLGPKDVKPTMIYPHVLNRSGLGVRSPLDR